LVWARLLPPRQRHERRCLRVRHHSSRGRGPRSPEETDPLGTRILAATVSVSGLSVYGPAAMESGRRWGETAVVIGAGIAGLSSAAALSPWFARVFVLERDPLPAGPEARASIPQGAHAHTLLGGGVAALEQLFPGVCADFERAGAVRVGIAHELLTERAPYDGARGSDCGFAAYTMTRPLLEHCLRTRLSALENVTLKDSCTVRHIDAAPCAVRYMRGRDAASELRADLVIDASGRAEPTHALLRELQLPAAEVTRVGLELQYASLLFDVGVHDAAWKAVFTLAQAPLSTKGALLIPVEHGRWHVSLGGCGPECPPGDREGFLRFVGSLRTPTIARALEHASAIGEPQRFGFPESRWHHFAELPERVLVLGDALCRFNPIYGQGMSSAAKQACLLAQALQDAESWQQLAAAVRAGSAALVQTAWQLSAIPDFMYRHTVGERPADLRAQLLRGAAIQRLAASDPEIDRLMLRVGHLLDPPAVLQRADIEARIAAKASRS
jgi:2-polyprenyl-6-methoxyphenol hydroxylase-like FAD-dependent oxidoreductase